jgi:hypothetical protein
MKLILKLNGGSYCQVGIQKIVFSPQKSHDIQLVSKYVRNSNNK